MWAAAGTGWQGTVSTSEGASVAARREVGLRVYRRLSSEGSRGLEEMRVEMGGPLAEAVVDFCLGELWERPYLDLRIRSLILIGVLSAMGDYRALRAHVKGAIAHGATEEEIREVFLLTAGYAGFARATGAAEIAEQIFRDRKVSQQDR